MISKNKLKELAAYRLQKRCDEEAVFVVEGPKMAAEALASGFDIRVVCATAEWLSAHPDSTVATETYEVSPAEMERLSNFKTPNQVWMLLSRPDHSALITHHSSLTLALDPIQDPGNLGTMLRTADWFGIRHVVCSRDTVDCYNPKVVQSSMGAVFRTQVDYVDLPQWLADCGMPVYGASLQGEPLSTLHSPLSTQKVLLIGNESRGISAEAMAHVTDPVLIPNIGGTAESLNATVAAGILMHWLSS
ncbi:MAG: RNA methyltransferase [Bacteroidales bacterium]|nr:RNA methyltransferase [Bacteroidales bacterium]